MIFTSSIYQIYILHSSECCIAVLHPVFIRNYTYGTSQNIALTDATMNNVPRIYISVPAMARLSWVIADPSQLLFATAILFGILTCWVCFEATLRHISENFKLFLKCLHTGHGWNIMLCAVSVSICRCQRVYFELNMMWQYLNMCFKPVRMLLYLQTLPSPGSSEWFLYLLACTFACTFDLFHSKKTIP